MYMQINAYTFFTFPYFNSVPKYKQPCILMQTMQFWWPWQNLGFAPTCTNNVGFIDFLSSNSDKKTGTESIILNGILSPFSDTIYQSSGPPAPMVNGI